MQLYPFKAMLPKLEQIGDLQAFFPTVKSKYLKYKGQDLFETTDIPSIYLYEIKQVGRRAYRGIIATTDVQHYINKDIKGHEATITAKEQKQLKMLEKRKAQVKPILLTYRQVPVIDAWMEQQSRLKPSFQIALDGNQHTFWRIQNTVEVQILADFFQRHVPTTYIADGHHRAASATNLYLSNPQYDRIMTAFFSFKDLDILDYNRIVEHPKMPVLLKHLHDLFKVNKMVTPAKPKQKHQISFYYDKQWYSLKWKKNVLSKQTKVVLDTDLLNSYVLKDLFNIQDIRTAPNIDYVGSAEGTKGIEQAVDKAPNRAGFCMYPVSLDDMAALVDLGEVLPPKSTWFEPRMLNGITVFSIDLL